jgi:hypothetical protein
MKLQITHVYQLDTDDRDTGAALVTPTDPAVQVAFESIQVLPSELSPSEARQFVLEMVRQVRSLTLGPTRKQEPRG